MLSLGERRSSEPRTRTKFNVPEPGYSDIGAGVFGGTELAGTTQESRPIAWYVAVLNSQGEIPRERGWHDGRRGAERRRHTSAPTELGGTWTLRLGDHGHRRLGPGLFDRSDDRGTLLCRRLRRTRGVALLRFLHV